MSEQPAPAKRRRGGQTGNKNALKHSFYASKFNRTEIKDLLNHNGASLQDEINMLRVFIRRVFEKTSPDAAVWEDIEILRSLALASHSLDRLVRTQYLVTKQFPPADSLSVALSESLRIVYKNLGMEESTTQEPSQTENDSIFYSFQA